MIDCFLRKEMKMIISIILITLLSCVANIIGTVSGFGVGTFMTPILLLFMPFAQTIVLVCIIHWFHDIWRLYFFYHGIDWKLFLYFGIPSIIAGVIGASLVTQEQSTVLSSLLGLFLISSTVILFYIPNFVLPSTLLNGLIGGSLSGFFAGIFGIRGAVRTLFLSTFDLRKATFLGTTSIIALLLDSGRLLTYWFGGLSLPLYLYWAMLLFIPFSFLGTFIGQLIVKKIPQKHFRVVVLIFLLIVGIKLFLTPWLDLAHIFGFAN
jgi:uncharacterized membrane protein YfcA